MATKKENEIQKITVNQRWKTMKVQIVGINPLAMQSRPSNVIENLRRKDNGLKQEKFVSSDMRRFIDSIHWIDETKKPNTLDPNITDDEYKVMFSKLVEDSKNSGEPIFYIPSEAFKESICKGAYRNGVTKNIVNTRSMFMILGDKAPIEFDDVVMEAVPTVNQNAIGKPMVISVYSKFINWKTELIISYNEVQISPDALVEMITLGGRSIGVLARRTELSFGKYGNFEVKSVKVSK